MSGCSHADGTVRVTFTSADLQTLYDKQGTYLPKTVVLHSTDGLSWSRDDVRPIVGFDTFGTTRVQVTDSNVLISLVDSNSRRRRRTCQDRRARRYREVVEVSATAGSGSSSTPVRTGRRGDRLGRARRRW